VQAYYIKSGYTKLVKYQLPNLAFDLVKTNSCQPQAKYLAKTFETLIK